MSNESTRAAKARELIETWENEVGGVDWLSATPEDYANTAIDVLAPTTGYELPNISVDVVPIAVNPVTNKLEIFVGKRIYEPFLGDYALPGVLLTPHERLDEAAYRALNAKTAVPKESVKSILDLGTFDNPDRDPRGATVSIAKLALVDSHVFADNDSVKRIPIDELASDEVKLPFDHNTIIRAAVSLFGEKFLSSKTFTKSVLGEQFTTKVVRGIMTQISLIDSDSDHSYDPSNLTRQLKSTGWVQILDETGYASVGDTLPSVQSFAASSVSSQAVVGSSYATSTSRGRPSRSWSWN